MAGLKANQQSNRLVIIVYSGYTICLGYNRLCDNFAKLIKSILFSSWYSIYWSNHINMQGRVGMSNASEFIAEANYVSKKVTRPRLESVMYELRVQCNDH